MEPQLSAWEPGEPGTRHSAFWDLFGLLESSFDPFRNGTRQGPVEPLEVSSPKKVCLEPGIGPAFWAKAVWEETKRVRAGSLDKDKHRPKHVAMHLGDSSAIFG